MSEEDTIHLKKDTVYKSVIGILAILLIISVVTGGFGFGSGTGSGAVVNTGNANNTAAAPVSLSAFTSNSELFPSLGPTNAKNTVVEFADFQCPWCGLGAGMAPWANANSNDTTVKSMISQSGDLVGTFGKLEQAAQQGQIRFIYVPMSFLGTGSVLAAQAAYCANQQGDFWQMHDAIFGHQVAPENEGTQFTIPQLEQIAAGVNGLDTTKFNSCLENNDTLSQVQQAAQQAATAASGTPTLYLNGQQISPSWSAVQAALK